MDTTGDDKMCPAIRATSISMILLITLSHLVVSDPQTASGIYNMDTASDCGIAGWLLIPTDGVTNIHSRKPGASTSSILACTLGFKPQDTRDIIDLTFIDLVLNDKNVTLRVEVSGASTYVLTAGMQNPGKITSQGGTAMITLTRTYPEDNDYYFFIIVRAYKQTDNSVGNVAVGLDVGIVGGLIGFLVILAIIIM